MKALVCECGHLQRKHHHGRGICLKGAIFGFERRCRCLKSKAETL